MTAPIGSDLTSFAATLQRADATSTGRASTEALQPSGTERAAGPSGPDFAERVEQLLEDVNAHQVDAARASEAYANGESNDMHGTMIALEQADITFRLVSNIRGRLIEAYREVMRMGA
ncbi:MAG TPA: flagellar hook-basal body complex protein FliE [Sandaracinaceae bacterium LLY-WYZ-13_1]|nr:flagellar hook-basal body complex protein FliE [Sandaracinaceae bacterium LLY-WYZ-13_1]